MKVVNVIECIAAFLLGLLMASYYPLPGIQARDLQVQCPEQKECPVGFATLEEMRFLVEELRVCNEDW